MAKRVLRDWTDSEKVDKLSEGAERFFARLIMKADDYGSYYANVILLKSTLFPLKENLNSKLVKAWLLECVDAGILKMYKSNGKEYLRIINFGQRMQNMRNKFPDPENADSDNSPEVTVSHRKSPPEIEKEIEIEKETEKEKETEVEKEKEGEGKTEIAQSARATLWPTFDDFWKAYAKNIGKPKCRRKWEKIKQAAREKIMQHLALYVRSTPDVKYRKNPLTYLNGEAWNDEIIQPTPTNGNKSNQQRRLASLVEGHANRYGTDSSNREHGPPNG